MAQHIMVIDDSSTFLDEIEDVLSQAGYATTTDIHMGTTVTKQQPKLPDLLIINTRWNEEARGLELVQELQLDPVTTALPIILCLSPKPDLLSLEDHLMAHQVRLLPKPFTSAELLTAIHQILM
ncbi:MAG: response regulator [Ktedonobacterales bacterium]|nr:response regulator [Ktedonobacterales bacterium]